MKYPYQVEQLFFLMEDALTECPTCGSPVRKVFGSVGIVFKGSGFYKNDSRSGSGSSSGSSESTLPASTKADTSASSSSDASGAGSTDKTSGSKDKPSKPATTPASAPAASSGSGSGSGSGSVRRGAPRLPRPDSLRLTADGPSSSDRRGLDSLTLLPITTLRCPASAQSDEVQ